MSLLSHLHKILIRTTYRARAVLPRVHPVLSYTRSLLITVLEFVSITIIFFIIFPCLSIGFLVYLSNKYIHRLPCVSKRVKEKVKRKRERVRERERASPEAVESSMLEGTVYADERARGYVRVRNKDGEWVRPDGDVEVETKRMSKESQKGVSARVIKVAKTIRERRRDAKQGRRR
jgi:hypothetical protein